MADTDDLEDDDVPAGPGRRYLTRAGAERMHAELLRFSTRSGRGSRRR